MTRGNGTGSSSSLKMPFLVLPFRLERESAWDQAVFNEEAAFPSSPVHQSPHVRSDCCRTS